VSQQVLVDAVVLLVSVCCWRLSAPAAAKQARVNAVVRVKA
jgi:hypothetical protein